MHIKSIYDDKELEEGATLKNFLTVRQEENRQVNRNLEYYKLDMIIAGNITPALQFGLIQTRFYKFQSSKVKSCPSSR